jgi:L-arabinose transport system substrate-binding protein
MKTTAIRACLAVVVAAGLVAACSSGNPSSPSGGAGGGGGKIKIGYITKQGTEPFASDQIAAAKEAAAKVGVELLNADVRQDTALMISSENQMLAQGVKGLIVVVPDQSIGASVISAAAAKGVAIIASDDRIKDAKGTFAPFVGLDGATLGKQAGEALAKQLQAKGWTGSDTAFLNFVEPTLTVCNERTDGASQGFAAAATGFTGKKLTATYDGTVQQSLTAMNPVLSNNPDVKHWLITGCNDAGAAGALRALEAKGVTKDNSIGVGMDGALACSELSKDNGFYGANYVSFKKNGELAFQLMYDHLSKGATLPDVTYVPGPLVTRDNYKQLAGC